MPLLSVFFSFSPNASTILCTSHCLVGCVLDFGVLNQGVHTRKDSGSGFRCSLPYMTDCDPSISEWIKVDHPKKKPTAMPELPEVETSRAYVEEFCQGSTIVKCHAMEQGGGARDGLFDDLVIGEGVTAETLKRSLEGRNIVALHRRGKQMWFVLDKAPHPLFHFGMTGAFTIKGEKRHTFVKFKIDESWPPRFTKLELKMSNGACLALTDPRRLARVRLRTDPETSPPISLLGPDPITHPLSLEAFAAALAKPTAPIKAVLLAQDRVVSGVGNWVADEVCFQACVHPGATCNTLSPEQVGGLHAKLLSVCREACGAQANYTVFPKEWLFHHRWGKGKSSGGAPRVSSGHPIHFDVVGGRTTAIVLAVQKKGLLSPGSSTGKISSSSSKVKSKGRSRKKENVIKDEKVDSEPKKSGHGSTKKVPPGKKGAVRPKPESISSKKQNSLKSAPSNVTPIKVKLEPVNGRKAPIRGKAKSSPKATSKTKHSVKMTDALKENSKTNVRKKRSREAEKPPATAKPDKRKRSKGTSVVKVEDTGVAETSSTCAAKPRLGRRSPRLAL